MEYQITIGLRSGGTSVLRFELNKDLRDAIYADIEEKLIYNEILLKTSAVDIKKKLAKNIKKQTNISKPEKNSDEPKIDPTDLSQFERVVV